MDLNIFQKLAQVEVKVTREFFQVRIGYLRPTCSESTILHWTMKCVQAVSAVPLELKYLNMIVCSPLRRTSEISRGSLQAIPETDLSYAVNETASIANFLNVSCPSLSPREYSPLPVVHE